VSQNQFSRAADMDAAERKLASLDRLRSSDGPRPIIELGLPTLRPDR
jgi:hypothetical protein